MTCFVDAAETVDQMIQFGHLTKQEDTNRFHDTNAGYGGWQRAQVLQAEYRSEGYLMEREIYSPKHGLGQKREHVSVGDTGSLHLTLLIWIPRIVWVCA